jgi:transcription-repair coupling factor (superfamily II helicase)
MTDDTPLGLEALRLLALEGHVLYVAAGEQRAEDLARALRAMDPATGALAFPPWDCLPYDWASPSPEAMGRRMAVLRRLQDDPPRIVVTSLAAVLQRVPPMGAARAETVRVGDAVDPDALLAALLRLGYRADERVDEPGEAALRGGVLDVYPPAVGPCRVEMADGRVTALRPFDPATQLSTGESLDALHVDAATEMPARDEEDEPGAEHWLPDAWPALATLPDHVGGRLVAVPGALNPARDALLQIAEARAERLRAEVEGGEGRRALPPDRLYLSLDEWAALEARALPLDLGGWEPLPPIAAASRPRAAFAEAVGALRERGRRVALAAPTARDRQRLARLVPDAARAESLAGLPAAPGIALLDLDLDRGFEDAGASLAVVTARDALGARAGGAASDSVLPWLAEAVEMREGDAVVHEDRGLARFLGLDDVPGGEALRLSFADGDLLVPAAEAGRVWRYGPEEADVTLDRLDGAAWARRRQKLDAGVAEAARAILDDARARAAATAPELVPEEAPYARVVARFAHEDTPDQRAAVAAVLADLASGRPMDRLVVGDVGFGKTEVAVRAAAACAFAGRQVAIVAPTTVLARQHAQTFARRFEGLAKVAHLSRLVPAADAKRAREGLADGSVRIAVGTHALLGRGVTFHDLGLVVIDEEQRFGSAHKRALRALATGAHVVTLTATPIPRTLQAALAGLQDLSVVATAPSRRRPVRTTVGPDDDATLRAALGRERRRGGQSFVVVPRVEDVEPTVRRLKTLLPRLRLRVAHGKLPPREIDEVMVSFAEGRGDVLLATSLIESGLDVPRANTMVVLRPDLFGLSQLHQLRGRVGRGGAQAACYLLYDPARHCPRRRCAGSPPSRPWTASARACASRPRTSRSGAAATSRARRSRATTASSAPRSRPSSCAGRCGPRRASPPRTRPWSCGSRTGAACRPRTCPRQAPARRSTIASLGPARCPTWSGCARRWSTASGRPRPGPPPSCSRPRCARWPARGASRASRRARRRWRSTSPKGSRRRPPASSAWRAASCCAARPRGPRSAWGRRSSSWRRCSALGAPTPCLRGGRR